jgi:hypothetical protein
MVKKLLIMELIVKPKKDGKKKYLNIKTHPTKVGFLLIDNPHKILIFYMWKQKS